MSNEQLKYIFGKSACLSPKQMKQYVRGHMANEECHAVEVHLNSCAFCNEAVEGLFEQQEGNAAEVAATLNTDFLKDHFSLHQPQVHLNSMAPAQPIVHAVQPKRRKIKAQPLWRPSSIAAVVLLGFGLLWYIKFGQKAVDKAQLAQALPETAVTDKVSEPIAGETRKDQSFYKDATAGSTTASPGAQPPQGNLGPNETPPTTQPPVVMADNVAEPEAKPVPDNQPEESTQKPAANEDMAAATYFAPPATRPDTKDIEVVETVAATRRAKTMAKMPETTGRQLSEEVVTSLESGRTAAKAEPSAEDLYDKGKYSAALKLYKEEMNNAGSRGKRQRAAIMVARCYQAIGNKQSARQILQSIIDEGGPQKRTAKKLLEDMDGATGTED